MVPWFHPQFMFPGGGMQHGGFNPSQMAHAPTIYPVSCPFGAIQLTITDVVPVPYWVQPWPESATSATDAHALDHPPQLSSTGVCGG